MCGIVGAVANRNVVPILLEGLRKLEYRGYDSAGLAVVNGGLQRLRSVGRVAALTDLVEKSALSAPLGIAHTRWATHGAPTEGNAHPHSARRARGRATASSATGDARPAGLGYRFVSDTDRVSRTWITSSRRGSVHRDPPCGRRLTGVRDRR
jgi:glucosamine--fructose-6-phosphate aminotransferase (isomerizing)